MSERRQAQKFILYDSVHMRFKNGQTLSTVQYQRSGREATPGVRGLGRAQGDVLE